MKIKINILEEITKKLFTHLKEQGISELKIEEDMYWNIDEEERYDPYTKPSKIDLGQLEDDWQELLKINEGKAEPVSYAFVWLSALLKRIGEKIIK